MGEAAQVNDAGREDARIAAARSTGRGFFITVFVKSISEKRITAR
jgi:hypothetical protein